MGSVPTWPVAAGSLLAGFAVAQTTGARPLGGLVLLAGVVWCARRWRAEAGTGRATGLVVAYAAAFAVSHALADSLGAWGSVAAVSAAVAALAYAVADARAARRPLTA